MSTPSTAAWAARSGCFQRDAIDARAECLPVQGGLTRASVTCCPQASPSLTRVRRPTKTRHICPRLCRNRVTATDINVTGATWLEAHAECLAHGRTVCTREQLENGEGCSFVNCTQQDGALLWTRTACGGSAEPKLDFQPLRHVGTCGDAALDLSPMHTSSFAECLLHCNQTGTVDWATQTWQQRQRSCTSIGYNFRSRQCKLMRMCTERVLLRPGQCEHWWMLRRSIDEALLLRLFPQAARNGTQFCYFTRGPTSEDSAYIRRARRNAIVWRAAEKVRSNLAVAHPLADTAVCGKKPLLPSRSRGTVINITYGRVWRYYTALECGSITAPRVCLVFKTLFAKSAVLKGITSTDGHNFSGAREFLRLPGQWREHMFTHNLAIMRLENDTFAMMGGMQGFITDPVCREEALRRRRGAKASRQRCLVVDKREELLAITSNTSAMTSSAKVPTHPATGIRLSRGRGLPWSQETWSMPKTVITGTRPSHCVDRRPAFTGFPRLEACEFDGRLALAHLKGRYFLYARANLKVGALAGGRFVQVTHSEHLEHGWVPWQRVQIAGIDSSRVDIYFFAVQSSPVTLFSQSATVLAIFPLTEPPWACIAMAASQDGLHFTHPINLQPSGFGVREHKDVHWQGKKQSLGLEWRGEDHPAMGIVRSPEDPERLLVYIHHAVAGTTIRLNATPHVRVYSISAEEIKEALSLV